MLDPTSRQIYLDELKPPEGYRLDCAIATTFSLDLMSLLMAPISMTIHGYEVHDDVMRDPIVLLDALQSAAGRFVVFCQQGHISVPKQDTLLYSYLENSVVEVQSRDPNGVFHAKTWLLRFTGEKEVLPIYYRFLCLSRNLTFERSWDTVLVLEGYLAESRKRAFSRNRPLGQFMGTLIDLAAGKVAADTQGFVNTMADEVLRVCFETPDEFGNEIQFIPTGIPGYTRFPKQKQHKRILIMSPFVSPGVLQSLVFGGKENIVISRPDSIDELKRGTLKKLCKNSRFFFMDTASEKPEEVGEEFLGDGARLSDFSGLHAKLIIMENGASTNILTGSANATNAAFNGRNVEFMVKLSGLRINIGIDTFLGNEEAKISFRSMLRPYEPELPPQPADKTQKELEDILERGRRTLANSRLSASIESETEKGYRLILCSLNESLELPINIRGECYPISLPDSSALDINPLKKGNDIVFRELTLQALTGFIAFRLTAYHKGEKAGIKFVLNPPVIGMPPERYKMIVRSILSDKERFIRYLLFILGGDSNAHSLSSLYPGALTGGTYNPGNPYGLPLLEEMIRAFSRDSEKIDRISRLIEELKEVDSRDDVLPVGFSEIWEAFVRAHQKE